MAFLSVITMPPWSGMFIPGHAVIFLGAYALIAGAIERLQAVGG